MSGVDGMPAWAVQMQNGINSHTDAAVGALRTELKADIQATTERVAKVEEGQKQADERISKLEAAISSGTCSSFVPSYFNIRGFCEWKDRKSTGISREQAEPLVARLKAGLPPSVQDKVGEIELRGKRVHKVIVHVTPPYATEVAVLFKDALQDPANNYNFNNNVLFTTVQMEPSEQRRFEAGGKARAFLDVKAKAKDLTAQVFHSGPPEFRISVKTAAGEVIMGAVDEKGTMQWDEAAIQRDFQRNAGTLRTFRSA